jgi:hypothetical protein
LTNSLLGGLVLEPEQLGIKFEQAVNKNPRVKIKDKRQTLDSKTELKTTNFL